MIPNKTLRNSEGQPAGEGDPVNYDGKPYYVDSWSLGAGVLYIRPTRERGEGVPVVEVRPGSVGMYIGRKRQP